MSTARPSTPVKPKALRNPFACELFEPEAKVTEKMKKYLEEKKKAAQTGVVQSVTSPLAARPASAPTVSEAAVFVPIALASTVSAPAVIASAVRTPSRPAPQSGNTFIDIFQFLRDPRVPWSPTTFRVNMLNEEPRKLQCRTTTITQVENNETRTSIRTTINKIDHAQMIDLDGSVIVNDVMVTKKVVIENLKGRWENRNVVDSTTQTWTSFFRNGKEYKPQEVSALEFRTECRPI